jgi:hypothetical protein
VSGSSERDFDVCGDEWNSSHANPGGIENRVGDGAGESHRGDTRAQRLTVDQNGARTALPQTTPELGAIQTAVVAQYIQ